MGLPVEEPHRVCVTFDLEIIMFRRGLAVLSLVAGVGGSAALEAQQPQELVRQLNRSGPRFGVTWLSGTITEELQTRYNIDVAPVITQFGWQFERQFASLENGPVALNEWVLLVGGLDQGAFLPSLTWLVGIRTPGNFEIGVGPNATPAGVALALSTGYTFKAGALAVPVNMAIVPSKYGVRASVLTGFNIYR
ncbi:MAG: hypothetical protein WD825_00500 [Gemmatimonadaceae bacterium]